MKKIKVHTLCKVDEQTFVYLLHTHSERKKTDFMSLVKNQVTITN